MPRYKPIDGVKPPSNASKVGSGKKADFLQGAEKMEAAVAKMLVRHVSSDAEPGAEAAEREAAKIRRWLDGNPEERVSAKGR